jgi:hypothetical protein
MHTSLFADDNSDEDDEIIHAPCPGDYFKEVLLTYRLLFGQDKRSWKRFAEDYSNQDIFCSRNPLSSPTTIRNNKPFDPLLYRLCAHSHLYQEFYDEISGGRAKNVYLATSDFPFLSHRLLALQEYVAEENPDSLNALWYDRRDILRWYTFWAVVIVGGASIVLSLIQIILGAAQVAGSYQGRS